MPLTKAFIAVFLSGFTFLISMLLLKFSHTVPTFGTYSHTPYAEAQTCVNPVFLG